jgi:hypothetical protein
MVNRNARRPATALTVNRPPKDFRAEIESANKPKRQAAQRCKSSRHQNGLLPRRQRGRQTSEAEARYREQLNAFCVLILQIKSTMDFAVGSRGWCYILERHSLRKGDFDDAEKLITACRKSGALPLNICAEDASRETIGISQLDSNAIPDEVESWVSYLRDHAHEHYTPISFWDDLDV